MTGVANGLRQLDLPPDVVCPNDYNEFPLEMSKTIARARIPDKVDLRPGSNVVLQTRRTK